VLSRKSSPQKDTKSRLDLDSFPEATASNLKGLHAEMNEARTRFDVLVRRSEILSRDLKTQREKRRRTEGERR
jgi:hypothetical protein